MAQGQCWAKSQRPYLKKKKKKLKQKRLAEAQVVECLPSKHKARIQTPVLPKNKLK
jgi:hypothetical protein